MPIHDWSQVEAGILHAFHHDWITEIARALNRGLLPQAYYALPEQIAGGLGPDVLTLSRREGTDGPQPPEEGGLALAVVPPQVKLRFRSEAGAYAGKAKAVVVRHVSNHRVVAMVEVVSPGNKESSHGLRAFVRKAQEALAAGVHLLLIDLFPPGKRDPQGIHGAIVEDDGGFALPPEKPLTCIAYLAGAGLETFLEPVAVGDRLPDMPLFLSAETYCPVPLEATYHAAWEGMPAYWRDVLTGASTGN